MVGTTKKRKKVKIKILEIKKEVNQKIINYHIKV